MNGKVIGSALVPGLPHLLSGKKSPAWDLLRQAYATLETTIAGLKPDALVIYSTQWMSVLGTSFQAQERPRGIHVDENWHEWGNLEFDFKSEVALSEAAAKRVAEAGFPTKLIAFEEFPIDTGTIVALSFLNQKLKLPVSIVSSWVYADLDKTKAIGAAMRSAVKASDKRVFALGVSSLSQRYFTDDITPETDRISSAEDDVRNRKLLGLLETGDLGAATRMMGLFSKEMPLDMGGKAIAWLEGIAGERREGARVLAYGPIWGAGNAVVFLPSAETI